MPFIPENLLEKALVEVVRSPASAPGFYRLLLKSDLPVLGSVESREPVSEKITLAPGVRLNLIPGVKDGSRFPPVFSSIARIQDYVKQESKYLGINGRAVLQAAPFYRRRSLTLN